MRADRRLWRLREDLAALDAETDDPGTYPVDLSTITVINDWEPVHFGHHNDGERELAAAIADRNRTDRQRRRIERRRAAA